MHAYLIRQYFKTHTSGTLIVNGEIFYTLERPWLNNSRNVSCIPSGEYSVVFLPRSASGKYKKVWHLLNVKNRSGILIHNGNLVAHSRGCLILGAKTGQLSGKPAVLQSRTAMRHLLEIVETEPFSLLIPY